MEVYAKFRHRLFLTIITKKNKGREMFAVIKTGGKQYRVAQGDVLEIEKLNIEAGKSVTFDEVLLVENNGETMIGTPYVDKAKVKAVVLESFKDEKIIVFKKKRRKQYKKKTGHRQLLTRIKIEEIMAGGKVVSKAKPTEKPKPKVKKEKPAEPKPRVKKVTPEEAKPKVKAKEAKAVAGKPKKAETEKPKKTPAEKPAKKAEAPKTKDKVKTKAADKPKPKAPAKRKTETKASAKPKKGQ
jgi:large subunit ribosomal protein L21